MFVPCLNNKYKIIILQTLIVVFTSLPATSVLFAVTCNSKKPSTKPTILLAVLSSPVSLLSLNTVLWLADTGTVSIIDGAREKNVELVSLYVIGWESESMSTASNVRREVSTGTFRRTPENKTTGNHYVMNGLKHLQWLYAMKSSQVIRHVSIQHFRHCICFCLQELMWYFKEIMSNGSVMILQEMFSQSNLQSNNRSIKVLMILTKTAVTVVDSNSISTWAITWEDFHCDYIICKKLKNNKDFWKQPNWYFHYSISCYCTYNDKCIQWYHTNIVMKC